jgi:hypothetical protein
MLVWLLCAYASRFAYDMTLFLPFSESEFSTSSILRIRRIAYAFCALRVLLLAALLILVWDNLELKRRLAAFLKAKKPGSMSRGLRVYYVFTYLTGPFLRFYQDLLTSFAPNLSADGRRDFSTTLVLYILCKLIWYLLP